MVPVQDGASTQGENLLLPPKEVRKMHDFKNIYIYFWGQSNVLYVACSQQWYELRVVDITVTAMTCSAILKQIEQFL